MKRTEITDWITPAEAAHAIGIGVTTLANWRAARRPNQPRFYKVGRSVKYRQSDVAKWISANTVQQPSYRLVEK